MNYSQLETVLHFVNSTKVLNSFYAIGLLVFGYFLAKRIKVFVEHAMSSRFSRHHVMLVSRGAFYIIFAIFLVSSLQHLGFKLSVLLGAAGVFTVAISFAAQTAASNLISGIFLLFERPFKMGDNIEVKGISGIVESIDLLSTKLKTADNKLVRIPNEALIKSEITNLSYFTIRRIDLTLAVSYNSDITVVKKMLLELLLACDDVLKEPTPNIIINNFTGSAVELKIMAWVNTAEITRVKNKLQEAIKQQFDFAGIEMHSTQMTIHQI